MFGAPPKSGDADQGKRYRGEVLFFRGNVLKKKLAIGVELFLLTQIDHNNAKG